MWGRVSPSSFRLSEGWIALFGIDVCLFSAAGSWRAKRQGLLTLNSSGKKLTAGALAVNLFSGGSRQPVLVVYFTLDVKICYRLHLDLLWLQGDVVSGGWLCRHLSRRLEMPRRHHWLNLDLRTRTVAASSGGLTVVIVTTPPHDISKCGSLPELTQRHFFCYPFEFRLMG
ncbi:hypothetical protein Taro_051451 [Colocasia esculenta]|uniref:Uncharacterized protein n=1 Tax=Colocasia esculenta TaxID=4460 RepID=A0A843XG44_COLES|nr:hypothetical protein [Colocasia esculenta]